MSRPGRGMAEEETREIEPREGARPEGGEQVAVGIGAGEERETLELPPELPVLPLKNTVLFPYLLSPLLVNTERSKKVIEAVLVCMIGGALGVGLALSFGVIFPLFN